MANSNIFFSTDPSTTALNNSNGSGVALLDEVLVNGGAAQALTSLTRSGSTATATFTAAQTLNPTGVYPFERNAKYIVLATHPQVNGYNAARLAYLTPNAMPVPS